MQSVVEQLSTYKSVHLNKKNVATHFIGVPAIVWSIAVFLSLIEFPIILTQSDHSLTLSIVIFSIAIIYYFMLNVSLAIGQVIFIIPVLYTAQWVAQMPNGAWIAVIVFIIAWIIQFIGHHYEKAKPAFVDDFNQLLIGPLFLMAELYFMLGQLKALENEITPLAIKKRQLFDENAK